jgi:two-component sensor histidine kinase
MLADASKAQSSPRDSLLERLTELDLPTRFRPGVAPAFTRFITGLMLAALAIALRSAVQQVAPGVAPFALIFPAVLAATMLSGWMAGALALMLASIADWRLFLPDPPGPAILTLRDAIELFLFVGSAAVLIFLTEAFVQGARASAQRRLREVREAQLEQERQTWIAGELNHRVKNTLAIVQTIARQTFRDERADPVASAEFSARLQALAGAHDLLLAGAWSAVDLRQMITLAVSPFAPSDRVTMEGPDLELSPQGALTLTLAFHELATNATKYGALSMSDGQVLIHWDVLGHGGAEILRLSWQESGGPTVTTPSRRGFGSQLIERGLKQDLGAAVTLKFAPSGLVCTIVTPLNGLFETPARNSAPPPP